MPEQSVSHLHRRTPHPRDFQHVVRAPTVVVVAVRIAKEFVAGRYPTPVFRARRQFGDPPILRKRTRAAHPEIADLAVTQQFSLVIHDLHFVARHGKTATDRKSTRLNSSHGYISYAVFCLKKKTKTT